MRAPDVTRNSPLNFWLYVTAVTALLAAGMWVVLQATEEQGLVRVMAAGALIAVAGLLYGPSTLDMTGWTLTVYAMLPVGAIILVGSPILYALWVAFVGPHVEVTIK